MKGRPVVFLLGPTASGKSAAAADLARALSGEIVSGDAFAVYRGLDIGTAKPPPAVRNEVRHHLIDIVDPSEPYSAGRWAEDARRAVNDIESRGRVPIVAGGSHFYLRCLLEGLPGEATPSPELRSYLGSRESPADLRMRRRALELMDPEYAETIAGADRARLGRGLEIIYSTGRRVSERARLRAPWAEDRRIVKIALQIPREHLYTRIDRRIVEMWSAGWPGEVEGLLNQSVPTTANCFRAIGYREIAEFLSGNCSEEETRAQIARKTRALVKRQRTWLASESDLLSVAPEDAVRTALSGVGR